MIDNRFQLPILFLVLLFSSLFGCVPLQPVQLPQQPQTAKIKIFTSPFGVLAEAGDATCITPCTMNIPTSSNAIVLSKEGFNSKVVAIKTKTVDNRSAQMNALAMALVAGGMGVIEQVSFEDILETLTPIQSTSNNAAFQPAAVDSPNTIIAPPVITISSPDIQRSLKAVYNNSSVTVSGQAESTIGVTTVLVNGKPASHDENGNFSTEVLLKIGENKITVAAMDLNGTTTSRSFSLNRNSNAQSVNTAPASKLSSPPLAFSSISGKNIALVIGINNYRNIEPLRTAVNDAKSVSKTLSDLYGFEPRLILDERATRSGILKELNNLRKTLTSDDRLLIYYAGHGEYDKQTESAYWLPVDAEKDDTTNWIQSKDITDELKRISAKQILMVADSCYSGTLTRKATTELSSGETRDIFLRKLLEKPARVLIASGGNEPVADAGGKGHSIFADAFINALSNPGKDVFTAEELLSGRLKESVAGRAEQTPEYKVIRNSGHDGGDFIFFKH